MFRIGAWMLGILIFPGAGAATDGLWELTTKMRMDDMPAGLAVPGMPGGPNKQTICMAEGRQYEPEEQKECKVLEQKKSGRTLTTRVQCREGTMTIEHEEISKSHWRSKMVMTGEDAITIETEGKRIGPCNAKSEGGMSRESQKMLDSAQAQTRQTADELTQACMRANTDWPSDNPFPTYDQMLSQRQNALRSAKTDADKKVVASMYPDASGCATAKAEYCTRAKTLARGSYQAYHAAAQRNSAALDDAFGYCGIDPAASLREFCKTALAASDVEFIAARCPAEREALSHQHCAGRDYSSVDRRFLSICLPGATLPPKPSAGGRPDVVGEGVKALKGLLGF